MAHYIFNLAGCDRDEAVGFLRAGRWSIDAAEPHRDALGPGDLALIYLAVPERAFIAQVELGSHSPGGVLLAGVEEWDPPVPMSAVLERIDRSAGARGDFDTGVVRITADEYETALAVAAETRA